MQPPQAQPPTQPSEPQREARPARPSPFLFPSLRGLLEQRLRGAEPRQQAAKEPGRVEEPRSHVQENHQGQLRAGQADRERQHLQWLSQL